MSTCNWRDSSFFPKKKRKRKMIQTKRLTKYYGSLAALVELDLNIQDGDIFGFIGPNGAGKTTTMRILTTYQIPCWSPAAARP